MPPRCFQLHSNAATAKFTLFEVGETLREDFDSFDEAYAQAEARATCESRLVLFNELGQVISETTVSPLEESLRSARDRWRKMAG